MQLFIDVHRNFKAQKFNCESMSSVDFVFNYVGILGMRYASLPNWDRAPLEHSSMSPAPFDAWTNVLSESEDSSRSGSEPQADRNQIM